MYWNTATCIRLVHLLFWTVSFAWLCCIKCATGFAFPVWSSSCPFATAHKAGFEWSHYGTFTRSWGRLGPFWQVGGTSVFVMLTEYLLICWAFCICKWFPHFVDNCEGFPVCSSALHCLLWVGKVPLFTIANLLLCYMAIITAHAWIVTFFRETDACFLLCGGNILWLIKKKLTFHTITSTHVEYAINWSFVISLIITNVCTTCGNMNPENWVFLIAVYSVSKTTLLWLAIFLTLIKQFDNLL